MGEYKEKLKSGGELIVTEKDWKIRYYFPGPDLRYNGTVFVVPSQKIDKYIEAWKNNFATYLKLKTTLNLDGSYSKIGEEGMKITIGGFRDGVSIDSWHMNVRTQDTIDAIVNDYLWAKQKAPIIQEMLRTL